MAGLHSPLGGAERVGPGARVATSFVWCVFLGVVWGRAFRGPPRRGRHGSRRSRRAGCSPRPLGLVAVRVAFFFFRDQRRERALRQSVFGRRAPRPANAVRVNEVVPPRLLARCHPPPARVQGSENASWSWLSRHSRGPSSLGAGETCSSSSRGRSSCAGAGPWGAGWARACAERFASAIRAACSLGCSPVATPLTSGGTTRATHFVTPEPSRARTPQNRRREPETKAPRQPQGAVDKRPPLP